MIECRTLLANKGRKGLRDLRAATTVLYHVLLVNLLFTPFRKIRGCNYGMFPLPEWILGEGWFSASWNLMFLELLAFFVLWSMQLRARFLRRGKVWGLGRVRRTRTWESETWIPTPGFCSMGLGLWFSHLASEWAGTRASDFVGASQWCFTLPEAMVVLGWPVLVSVAGVGRVKKGIHEVLGRDSPPSHFHYSLWVFWWDRDVFVVKVLTNVVSAVFKKAIFCVCQSWPFSPVVWAHLSHGLIALDSLLLDIREHFLERWWCVVKTGTLI